MPAFRDLTGMRFGRLTVVERAETVNERTRWSTRCDCGGTVVVRSDHLHDGHVRSCGCLHAEWVKAADFGALTATHGMSGTPEYKAFKGARDRCNSPRHVKWHGRGIRFRFRSFEEFYAELGPRPSRSHSVDRIDNDGDYAPGNVRWATPKEQAANTRRRKKAA